MAQKAERATDEAHAHYQAHETAKQEMQRLVKEATSLQASCEHLQRELKAAHTKQKVSFNLSLETLP